MRELKPIPQYDYRYEYGGPPGTYYYLQRALDRAVLARKFVLAGELMEALGEYDPGYIEGRRVVHCKHDTHREFQLYHDSNKEYADF